MKKAIATIQTVILAFSLVGGAASTSAKDEKHLPATSNSGFAVSGPIQGGGHGWAFGAYFGDIKKLGYVEEEYFLGGVAQRYSAAGALTPDGKWTVEKGSTSPYKTRILVRRPRPPGPSDQTGTQPE